MPALCRATPLLRAPGKRRRPTAAAWSEINAHLDTTAKNLPELVEQLGQRSFDHTPRVGDSFCGGGSIPFEAARIGCAAFGSDLNPVAGLTTADRQVTDFKLLWRDSIAPFSWLTPVLLRVGRMP
jgi:hypothetical protein